MEREINVVNAQMRAIAAMPERALDQRAMAVLRRHPDAARSKER